MARLALVAALALVLLAAPAAADAKWFGAKLKNRPANATATCQSFIFFQQVPSCSWTTSGRVFDPSESMVVPGTGRITRVKVKVGNSTGPMRITIAESLRHENSGEAACCVGRSQTKKFTPRRNRTRTLRTNLPVRVKFNEQSRIWSYDSIFISMENQNTVIPANAGDPNTDHCSGGWFPRLRPGQENFTGPYGVCGYTVLIRAKWEPRNG